VIKQLVQNAVFEQILQLSSSTIISVRKEALIVISYIATELDSVELLKLCMDYEEFIKVLVNGLKMTSS
jgi:hypothetical protein